ncbi:NAD(+) synthase [Thiorhodovibrio frisius]|uniref:Glutamine-dependent NAD(+) synthetase n=1 Tax=Thiorhodovibrio frisius TaxID=631362 RepID=H8YXK5_9GAMM|nr:NAD(+) synthase [Thiorhodovibrio frisius]EIC23181.1 NAD synthase [Thiorhodovibrio frisius]WPL22548.1 Glutamine-dependent NAD(+) synthetase [Thiorhodovibrio frisius]
MTDAETPCPPAGDFFNLYHQGLVRVAVCVPEVVVADPSTNARATLRLAQQAAKSGALVALFPELGLSAYSNEDLFQQQALLDASLAALDEVRLASREFATLLAVGLPLAVDGRLFNTAVLVHQGRLLGAAPKSYLPNFREFYEKRQFSPARDALSREISLLGETIPFGNDLLFEARNLPGCVLHMELCEDLWTPIPPSTHAALAGATLLLNLSASNITIGKAAERNALCAAQSGKCLAAYLYSAAGPGESSTDLAWDGHAVIYENGQLLAESERFAPSEQIILADIDLDLLIGERRRRTSFGDAAAAESEHLRGMRRIGFAPGLPGGDLGLRRRVERFPFVPADSRTRDAYCYEAYNIQVQALAKRLAATSIERLVIGVSGGLDSTQALLVAARTMDRLGLPRTNVLAYTLPGFATGESTRVNAWTLMRALGVTAAEIDIRPSCLQMLQDLGHPFADGQPVHDVTFENVQAGERTSHLFRLANHHQALVLGTGDLSEIALGWSTYGVGDQMSHYNVNASVSKTLIQYLIRWLIASNQFDDATNAVLQRILDTEISPELVPPDAQGHIQSTQDIIGPYELQDFHLYYISRYGLRPSKVAFLAWHAWHDRAHGPWPDGMRPEDQQEYDLSSIRRWLEVFVRRFFGGSQFKRSCMPNGPKVSSGGSLSPRGDWRAPSDAVAAVWLDELRQNVPNITSAEK